VDYLTKLPVVQDAVIDALRTLGDGNWNMGVSTGNMRKVGESVDAGQPDVLEHFTCKTRISCV